MSLELKSCTLRAHPFIQAPFSNIKVTLPSALALNIDTVVFSCLNEWLMPLPFFFSFSRGQSYTDINSLQQTQRLPNTQCFPIYDIIKCTTLQLRKKHPVSFPSSRLTDLLLSKVKQIIPHPSILCFGLENITVTVNVLLWSALCCLHLMWANSPVRDPHSLRRHHPIPSHTSVSSAPRCSLNCID